MITRRSFARLLAAAPFLGAAGRVKAAEARVNEAGWDPGIGLGWTYWPEPAEFTHWRNCMTCVRSLRFDRVLTPAQFSVARDLFLPKEGEQDAAYPFLLCSYVLPWASDSLGTRIVGARVVYRSADMSGPIRNRTRWESCQADDGSPAVRATLDIHGVIKDLQAGIDKLSTAIRNVSAD